MLLAACGGTAAPASQAPALTSAPKPAASSAAPAASAKPATSGAAEAKPAASGAAEAKPSGPAKLDAVKLAEGVYGVQAVNAGMNTGFVVGDEAVLTFACNPGDYEQRIAAIRTVSDKPIKWHVNGHTAGDDVGCNPDFKKMGATLYGSVKMKEDYDEIWPEMLRAQLATPAGRQVYANRSTPTPPDVTFADEMTLSVGQGKDVRLMYMGKGHTIGDAIAWLPDQKVMLSADLTFNQNHPTSNRGDTINWQKILDRMMAMAPNAIVTGHGAIATTPGESKKVLDDLSQYFTYVRGQVKGLMDKGRTLEQIKAEIDWTPYKSYGRTEQMPENIAQIYKELGGK
jgi:glyoxylase-like metal-dependent hydrolase (beta-lactamase superfamily II)